MDDTVLNQDIILAVALPVTLFCIMFSMGASLVPADFRRVIESPVAMFTGIFSQMILLPLLAFALLYPMQLPAEIFVGFMILALSPGGTTSNMFSYLAGGYLALSISLTAIISVITPFTLPLVAGWILAYQFEDSVAIQLPFLQTLSKLVVVTLIPVIIGMLFRRYQSAFCLRHEFWITRIPLIMLLLVIMGIIQQNWQKMPYFVEQTGLPALALATLALLVGYGFARLVKQNTRTAITISIETSIQNGGTAILVTGTILNNPAMTIAPVMYGILMLIPIFLYLLWLKLSQVEVVA
jgi:BASS family bile acid:Na+ symporter